jgi:hypothetical protein
MRGSFSSTNILCGRKNTTKPLRPRWASILEAIKTVKNKNSSLNLIDGITVDDIESFARHSNNRNGSNKPKFYYTLFMFCLSDQFSSMVDHEFFRSVCPASELDVVRKCEAEILQKINPAAPHLADTGSVDFRFDYSKIRLNSFQRYFETFKSSADGMAEGIRFFVYRPRQKNPNQIMKSFLSITTKDGEVTKSGDPIYRFTHIYQPPSDAGERKRISLGRVLPLADSLYLVGGQKPTIKQRIPFTSLKIISIPWSAIERQEHDFGGLVMSANYGGIPLISRVAIRVTCFPHSDQVNLGCIDVEKLSNSILDDMLAEAEIIRNFVHQEARPVNANEKDTARRIKRISNNNPDSSLSWSIGDGFSPKKLTQKTAENLTNDLVQKFLIDKFGNASKSIYSDVNGDTFEFWSSLRFSPLSAK